VRVRRHLGRHRSARGVVIEIGLLLVLGSSRRALQGAPEAISVLVGIRQRADVVDAARVVTERIEWLEQRRERGSTISVRRPNGAG